MLIFISDLHFVDGTAGEHNVPADAFRLFFESISAKCDWLKRDGKKVEEIKIVLLGDVFDLLRTEKWFEYPENERPWGSDESKIEEHANEIFDAIVRKNGSTFDLLGSPLKERFKLPVEPERVYVPGNHDRLCNKYESLGRKVCQYLNIPYSGGPFQHHFMDTDYGVFARHGHEYDKFNYEGGISYSYEDYMRVPIGDPITTELVAKLPYVLMQSDDVKRLPEDEQEALKRNFQEIENVRPFSATLEWLLYQVKRNLRLKEAIEDAVDRVIREFNELEFVQKWYEHHDKLTEFWDEADEIQMFLFLLEKLKIFSFERFMSLLEKLKKKLEKNYLSEAAAKEFVHLDSRIRYVVYGHTHMPDQVALQVVENPHREHVYINTGTWRTRYHKSVEGVGFIGWKSMTYVIFYKPEERGTDFPAFETWVGSLKVTN